MPNTTIERVYSIASHLRAMPVADLQVVIDDAYSDVIELYRVPEVHAERLSRWLAAHMATINVRRAISHEVTGAMKVQFERGNGDDDTSEYLTEFKRLLDLINGLSDGGTTGLGLVVI